EGVNFSVLGLGDSSYTEFCKMGKDFNERLAALGGNRILDLVTSDVDFEPPYARWISAALAKLKEVAKPVVAAGGPATSSLPAPAVLAGAAGPAYDKANPFPAPLLKKINLNGTGSAKETIHAEISLEGSGLTYQPGDALGVMPENAPDLIGEFLQAAQLDGRERIAYKEELSVSFEEVLVRHLDLRTINGSILQMYA